MYRFQIYYFFLVFFLDAEGLVFTIVFKVAPALNLTDVEAAILIAFPFAGLRPVLAALSVVSNVPKPTS